VDKTIVDQVEVKEASIDAISLDSLTDQETLELADVVTAIRRASDNEISTINQGFDQLKSALVNSFKNIGKQKPANNTAQTSVKEATNAAIHSEAINNTDSHAATTGTNPRKNSGFTDKVSGKDADTSQSIALAGGRPIQGVNPQHNTIAAPAARKRRQLDLVEVAPELASVSPQNANQDVQSISQITNVAGDESNASNVTNKTSSGNRNKIINSRAESRLSKRSAIIDSSVTEQYKVDAKGRLRNERGAYASKVEQKQYKKATKAKADEATDSGDQPQESVKQTSLLKQLLFSSAKIATLGAGYGVGRNGLGDKDGTIKNTAGMAVGGSYFLAAQEVATMMNDIKDSFKDSGIESFGDAVNKVKEKAKAAKDSLTGFGGKTVKMAKAVQMRVTGKDDVPPVRKPVKRNPISMLMAKLGLSKTSNDNDTVRESNNVVRENDNVSSEKTNVKSASNDVIVTNNANIGASNAQNSELSGDKGVQAQLFNGSDSQSQGEQISAIDESSQKAVVSNKEKPVNAAALSGPNASVDGKVAPKWIKANTNPLFRFFARLQPKATKTDEAMLTAYKSEAKAEEQRHQESLIALGDIKDGIKGIEGGEGGSGLLGDALDFMGDRKKRKKGRNAKGSQRSGRLSGSNGSSRRTGSFELPEKSERVNNRTRRGSAYGSAGRSAASVGTTGRAIGGSVAGGAVKAGGSMAGGALKAGGAVLSKLALPLTIAMAAYDGFQGYNDTEGQKDAFKLKEGQEASVGQKASSAAGSVLSLGGLTDFIGISSADISKAVYKSFGGSIEGEESPMLNLMTPITLLTSAISSFSAITDTDKIKSTFGVDKDTDVSTGQRAASLAGSALSMGGLSNLFFDTNSEDISKSIYSFFGGKAADSASNEAKAKEQTVKTVTDTVTLPVTDTVTNTVTPPASKSASDSSDKPVSVIVKDPTTQPATNTVTKPVTNTVTNTVTDKLVNNAATTQPAAITQAYPLVSGQAPARIISNNKQTEDIEQIESVNKLKESIGNKERDAKTTNVTNSQLIGKGDPEIVKLLKSIDKKLDSKKDPAPFRFGGGNTKPSSATAIPKDFTNADQRQQANNLG
jgi:hypothetical protein